MERKITNIKERILYFTDFKGFSKEIFFEDLQITYGNFKGKAKNQALGSDVIERILTKYPEINAEWLLTGKGEMIKSSTQNISIEGQNKNLNNINGGNNINISQNDISEIIEIQREMNNIIKTAQSQLTESQKQITNLIEILKSK